MTFCVPFSLPIIPLRERIGNYDIFHDPWNTLRIIPLRERIGKYFFCVPFLQMQIPAVPPQTRCDDYKLKRKWGIYT